MEVSDEQLRAAVAASRSWRGVLRQVGKTSPRTGRELKERCDALGITYGHFGSGVPDDASIVSAVESGRSWQEVLERLGYARHSGSARASVRKRCAALGVGVAHLSAGPHPHDVAWDGEASLQHLPAAAPMLVGGALTLAGHRVSWPLEPAPYDLLTDSGGQMRRVQVKATRSLRDGTWVCSLTHSTYDPLLGRSVADVYTPDQIDAFGIVDGDLRVYLLPIQAVSGLALINVRHYAAFRLPLALSA